MDHWERVRAAFRGEPVDRVPICLWRHWPVDDHKVEVGWRLDKRFWGKGLATEGAIANLSYGFERLGLTRIISICDPRNKASQRVMEKAGLSFQGEVRWRGYDDVWYASDRREWLAGAGRAF